MSEKKTAIPKKGGHLRMHNTEANKQTETSAPHSETRHLNCWGPTSMHWLVSSDLATVKCVNVNVKAHVA